MEQFNELLHALLLKPRLFMSCCVENELPFAFKVGERTVILKWQDEEGTIGTAWTRK